MVFRNDAAVREACQRFTELRVAVPNGLYRDTEHTGIGVARDGSGYEVCVARTWDSRTNQGIVDFLVFAAETVPEVIEELRRLLEERQMVRASATGYPESLVKQLRYALYRAERCIPAWTPDDATLIMDAIRAADIAIAANTALPTLVDEAGDIDGT